MAQEIEIEFKNLLTKQEFERLLHSLPFPKEAQTQTNHYFETADFQLKKHGSALRIREKNNTYTLTLKEPHSTGLLETHDKLTKQEAEDFLNGKMLEKEYTARQLAEKEIEMGDLIYFGSLTTHRREVEYKDLIIVLDYSLYHNTADYELEMEAQSAEYGQTMMKDILEKYNIEKRPTPNKIQRFFAAKPGNI